MTTSDHGFSGNGCAWPAARVEVHDGDAQPVVRLLAEPFAERQPEHEDEQQRRDEQDHRATAGRGAAGGGLSRRA